MNKLKWRETWLSLLLACSFLQGSTSLMILSGQSAVNVPDSKLLGAWTWTAQPGPDVRYTSVLDLELDAEGEMTGSIRNPGGERLAFTQIKQDQHTLELRLKHTLQGQFFDAFYSGKYFKDRISGKVEIRFEGHTIHRSWEATRLPAYPLAGDWDWALQTPDGNELKALLVVEHDAKGIRGQLISDQFQMPLQEIAFSNGQLEFKTRRSEDGSTFHSKGSWQGNRLSGQVSSPSLGEGLKLPWVATRRP